MFNTKSLFQFVLTYYLVGCSTRGSTILTKSMDTADTQVDSATDTPNTIPSQPDYTTWSGTRTVIFPELCVFTITEIGRRLTDPTHDLVQLIASDCPLCQVYELENTPESVECGDLGTLTTGGKRYRVLLFKEQYTDGTLNVRDGAVELWHAIEPQWQLDYITDAEFNEDTNGPEIHQWVYEADSNFQAFRYAEAGSFTLSDAQ